MADNNEYALYVSLDSDTVKDVSADVYMLDDSEIVRSYSLKMTVNGYGVIKAEMPWTIDDDRIVVCDIRYEVGTDRCFYKSGTLNLKPCDSDIVVSRSDTDITVTAKRYIHAVELECEETLEDNYFSLLEGEKRVIRVDCADCITVKAYSL